MILHELTPEEQKAIRALKRLAKTWPKSLWLYSGSGTLNVMKKDSRGNHVVTQSGGMDQDYVVATADIENDGGDW